jgi:hypothetical protein
VVEMEKGVGELVNGDGELVKGDGGHVDYATAS